MTRCGQRQGSFRVISPWSPDGIRPRVFLRCTSGRLGQSITLTETLAFVCWIKGSQYPDYWDRIILSYPAAPPPLPRRSESAAAAGGSSSIPPPFCKADPRRSHKLDSARWRGILMRRLCDVLKIAAFVVTHRVGESKCRSESRASRP